MKVLLTVIVALAYLVYDVISHGPLFSIFFGIAHGVFYKRPRLAAFFGIKFRRSDEFSTNRDDTRINVTRIGAKFTGFGWEFGNKSQITHLKMSQRKAVRPLDLAPYFAELVDKRLSVMELEEIILNAWVNELIEAYEIPISDRADFAHKIKIIRTFTPTLLDSLPRGLLYLVNNFREFLGARAYLTKLDVSKHAIMTIPFLTTVDSSIFNFVTTPEPITEFNELFKNVPVEYLPLKSKGRLVLLQIVSNGANNPGNSVFGPKGMICPGNIITSNLMKSVAQLKEQYHIKVEGTVKQNKGVIRYVSNPTEVFVTFSNRDAPYVPSAALAPASSYDE